MIHNIDIYEGTSKMRNETVKGAKLRIVDFYKISSLFTLTHKHVFLFL